MDYEFHQVQNLVNMEDFFENMDDTFDNGMLDTYTTTTLRELEMGYVVRKGTKTIEIVDEVEDIGGVKIIYTKLGNSYAEHQVEDIGVVFNYISKDE